MDKYTTLRKKILNLQKLWSSSDISDRELASALTKSIFTEEEKDILVIRRLIQVDRDLNKEAVLYVTNLIINERLDL